MNNERTFFICRNCLKENHLKAYCRKKGDIRSSCIICKNEEIGIKIDNSNKKEISNLFKSCLRFNYSEIEYNPALDNSYLNAFFQSENKLLNHQFKNPEEFNELISLLFRAEEEDIKIFYGKFPHNGEEYVGQFFHPLKNESSEIWISLKRRLKKENYYAIKPDLIIPLRKIVDKTKIKINKDRVFFRARIGNDKLKESEYSYSEKPIPFQGSKISAPPPLNSTAGRLNREGVSYLYLSSRLDTAISEIRPNPGDIVSVGKFSLLKSINLIDLRKVNLLKFINSQEEIELFSFALQLSKEFMKPKTDTNTYQYLITQFVAESFREIGQDGIIFNSAVSNGFNITVFNPNLFEFVPESSTMHRVKKVSFKSTKIEFKKDEFGFYVENEI